ncbi:Hypothetical Protein FCC1311_020902 [Hondaea fermentalgiana]|uniref:Uncharacterized protein n=1 Tax=Hondaea fermentalgiana TaxID=2315210 RepID=A0A2R5GCI9_9STRA|nr:Hypothetical Protein FCC1311_020902 [Hondaea fermentalgiana]|eukprot:GBG25871.1 Hypothetical Protein FCC1311_020902 [Hondaea fermentalgiana]
MQRAAHLGLEYDADSEDEAFVDDLDAGLTCDEFEAMVEIAEQEEYMTNMFAWTQAELDGKQLLERELETLRGAIETPQAGNEGKASPSSASSDGDDDDDAEKQDQLAQAAKDDGISVCAKRLQMKFKMCVGDPNASDYGIHERVGALYPFNCARKLSPRCCTDKVVASFLKYWTRKREAQGSLLHRFNKSDLLVNWPTTDLYADEDDLTGPDAMTRRSALSMLYTLRAMHDDFVQVETLMASISRREQLKLQLITRQ